MSRPETPGAVPAQPKQLSSNVLAMKFMQRSAASNTTPASSVSRTPVSGSPYKRRRVEQESESSDPSTPRDTFADKHAVSAALKAEQELIANARLRNTREGDETHWVLNVQLLGNSASTRANLAWTNGRSRGDAAVGEDDEEHDDIWGNVASGRQTYGSFKQRRKQDDTTVTNEDDDDDQGELSNDSSGSDASSSRHTGKKAAKKNDNAWKPGSNRSLLSSATGLRLYDKHDKRKQKPQKGKSDRKKPRKTI